MVAQSLSLRTELTKAAVISHVLLPGAVWFVPADTLIVITAEPLVWFTLFTVTCVPLTLTVATLVSLDSAEIVPFPARVTLIVPVGLAVFNVREVGVILKLPAALPIVHETLFAVVVPSDHS